MSFPSYVDYKDSGVAWLGAVPGHWSVERITNLYREVIDSGDEGLPILSVSIHSGVSDDELDPEEMDRKVTRSDDRSKYKKVQPNDLVYNMMRAWQGGFGAVQVPGMVSPAYVVARPKGDVPSKYVELLLRTSGAVEEMRRRSRGVTDFRLRLYWDEFKDMRIALPPAPERLAIVAFLERETAKIDGLVAEQERLIALLKEKHQGVISHAVTKGLNPDAPLKDSDIEWLGQIPAHWDVVRIKHVVATIEQGWSPQCDATPVDGPQQWGVLKVGCVNGDRFNASENKALPADLEPLPELGLRAGDVLISRANTRELVGSAALIEQDYERLLICDKLYRLRLRTSVALPEFLTLFFRSSMVRGQIAVAASGASNSMLNIGQSVVLEMALPLPPLAEQDEIAAWILQSREQIATLISHAQSAITLLQERRAALISAAVTGKIDVRATLPQDNVVPILQADTQSKSPSLRAVVGAYAIHALGPKGRMAVMKGGFLAEAHAGLHGIGGHYERYAAGPYDRNLIAAMEQGAHNAFDIQTIEATVAHGPIRYTFPKDFSDPSTELTELVGAEKAKAFRNMLAFLTDIDREGVEAVATLYSVWNDLLASGQAATEDAICHDFLTNWDPEKPLKFKKPTLTHWLDWMRRHGFVPDGSAPRTDHQGSLFA